MDLKRIKGYLKEAILGFVLWTICLTPYMMLVVRVTIEQYGAWLVMQALLVPFIAVVVYRITKKLCK